MLHQEAAEFVVEQQVVESLVLLECTLDSLQEAGADDATAFPDAGDFA